MRLELGTLITYSSSFSIREVECLEGLIDIDMTGGSETTRATQARVIRLELSQLPTEITTAGATMGVVVFLISNFMRTI
jgi:hypothetical protein